MLVRSHTTNWCDRRHHKSQTDAVVVASGGCMVERSRERLVLCQGSVPESGFLVLQILNLSHELIHCGKNPFLLHRIVGLFQLQNNIFFVILQFLCNFLQDLPAKLCFSFRILHIASTFPFERDQSIGSPVRAPFSGIQNCRLVTQRAISAFGISHSLLSNSDCASDTLAELYIRLSWLDRLSVQRSHEGLIVRTESFPFPFGNPAHSPILDFFFL